MLRRISAAALLIVAGSAGCGRQLPEPADPTQARELLRVVLDAWQQGGTAADLQKRTPAIHFKDEDWNNGWTLKSFQIAPTDEVLGQQRRCGVKLTLQSPKGKAASKDVRYDIDIAPAIVIVRTFE